jgi:hypothetical protein
MVHEKDQVCNCLCLIMTMKEEAFIFNKRKIGG